jgi:hypothetical protein
MNQDQADIISKQTGVTDMLLIEKTYYACDSDVAQTILTLMDVVYEKPAKKPRTLFDDIREIVDEKATVYQNMLNHQKHIRPS